MDSATQDMTRIPWRQQAEEEDDEMYYYYHSLFRSAMATAHTVSTITVRTVTVNASSATDRSSIPTIVAFFHDSIRHRIRWLVLNSTATLWIAMTNPFYTVRCSYWVQTTELSAVNQSFAFNLPRRFHEWCNTIHVAWNLYAECLVLQ
jgi:hypothetical protein